MSELRGELSERERELDSLRARERVYLEELAALKIEIDTTTNPVRDEKKCFSSTKNNNSSDLISFESAETTLIVEETVMQSCVSTLGGEDNNDDLRSSIIVIQRPLHEATITDEDDVVEEEEDYKKRYFELREGLHLLIKFNSSFFFFWIKSNWVFKLLRHLTIRFLNKWRSKSRRNIESNTINSNRRMNKS